MVPYSDHWVDLFEEEVKKLEEVFSKIPIQLHHIGSTSIPGCLVKPKIDILGVTHDITIVGQINEKIQQIGYLPLGEYGMKQRRFFSRHDEPSVNLHVFEDSDPEVVRHLRFGDFLRSHPELVEEYSKLKKQLAERYPGNMHEYCLGKDQFIKTIDYKAALEDPGKYFDFQIHPRKSSWSHEEILRAMEANMYLQMTYFTKYVPAIDIILEPDVTVVYSSIQDDTFNYVIGARFEEYNVKGRVEHVLSHYRKDGTPFSWWVGESDTPKNLTEELTLQGLTLKEDDIGMYLSLGQYDVGQDTLDLSMKRVIDERGLRDFARVFGDIGGYPTLYHDLYRKVSLVLIADGGPYEMYVGYLADQPIVTGILVLHANVGGIYYVMTIPQQRRKGYGTQMMKFLLNRAKEKDYHLVTLQASKNGRGLYERLGFQSICRFVEYA